MSADDLRKDGASLKAEISALQSRLLKAVEVAKEFIRIDGFISMHEMFAKDWEPAVEKARDFLQSIEAESGGDGDNGSSKCRERRQRLRRD